jgi:hypothetical protein
MKKIIRGFLFAVVLLVLIAAGYVLGVMYLDISPQSFISQEGTVAVQQGDNVYPTLSQLEEDFEDADEFLDLFDPSDLVFTQITLQSPAAPSVEEYVALRKCIFTGECGFIDNRIEVSREVVHSGQQSLRFFAAAPLESNVSKTSLDTTLLYARKGDQLWFSAYYYVAGGMPRTLADFETTTLMGGPGPRLILLGDLASDPYLGVELKHGFKPTYRQEDNLMPFPRKQWVHVLLHLTLSNQGDGRIQVWQDCQLIVDARGRNLPKADSVLDRMQLGITATDLETTLFLDDLDLVISAEGSGLRSFCP